MTVRALIVDDSATMRAIVSGMLSQDESIEVVGTAESCQQARAMIKQLDPDVVTLDVEMPGMNGIDFLEKIMTLRPMPVIMLSSHTQEGAEAYIRALELGAFDCLAKSDKGLACDSEFQQRVVDLVKVAGSSRRRQTQLARSAPAMPDISKADYRPREDALIALGSSTGGVEALIELIGAFPANCPPTVIVQHMPGKFTTSFADRLDRRCAPRVKEADHGELLRAGHVYLAPGSTHHLEIAGKGPWRCRIVEGEKESGHRPSVDRLFSSVARVAGRSAVGAILTGMGADGAHGLRAMREMGSTTIGQDRATSVVYGMPGVAWEIGAVTEQLPLSKIANRLLLECRA